VKILALAQPLKQANPAELMPTIVAETQRAWALMQQNVIREIYVREDNPLTVVILECASADEARQILSEMPLAKAGVITFEIIPLAPFSALQILFQQG
jgi:hypothetical protein